MRERARLFGGSLAIVDIALTLLALYLADLLRHALPIGAGDASLLPWLAAREYVVVAVVWAFFFRMVHLYDHRRLLRVVDELRALIPAILFATIVLFAAFFILKVEFLSRLLFIYFIALDALLLINLRWLLNLVMRSRRISGRGATRVLVVGAGPVGERVASMIRDRPWSGFQVVGFADDDPEKRGEQIHDTRVLGGCDELEHLVERYEVDDVLIALPMHAHERMREIVVALDTAPVRVRLVPDVFHLVAGRAMAEDVWGLPLISVRAPVITGFDRFVKRMFDSGSGRRGAGAHGAAARGSGACRLPGRRTSNRVRATPRWGDRSHVHHVQAAHHGRGRRKPAGRGAPARCGRKCRL